MPVEVIGKVPSQSVTGVGQNSKSDLALVAISLIAPGDCGRFCRGRLALWLALHQGQPEREQRQAERRHQDRAGPRWAGAS